MEHAFHIRHRRRVPSRDVLVEGCGEREHVRHRRHLRRVPSRDALVEGCGVIEHAVHSRHLRRIPRPDCDTVPFLAVHGRRRAVARTRRISRETVSDSGPEISTIRRERSRPSAQRRDRDRDERPHERRDEGLTAIASSRPLHPAADDVLEARDRRRLRENLRKRIDATRPIACVWRDASSPTASARDAIDADKKTMTRSRRRVGPTLRGEPRSREVSPRSPTARAPRCPVPSPFVAVRG